MIASTFLGSWTTRAKISKAFHPELLPGQRWRPVGNNHTTAATSGLEPARGALSTQQASRLGSARTPLSGPKIDAASAVGRDLAGETLAAAEPAPTANGVARTLTAKGGR